MNIRSLNLHTIQPAVNAANTVQQVPFMQKPQCGDQLTLSNKSENKPTISFKGIFGPPKVDKKYLNELVSIMDRDPVFNNFITANNVTYDFPAFQMLRKGDEIHLDMGFKNSSGFYKKVEAKVNTKTAVLTFKSVDGLKYKEGDIKYAVNSLFSQIIDYYKERM